MQTKIHAGIAAAGAVAIRAHASADRRHALAHSRCVAHSAEATVRTMNGRSTPFEDDVRAICKLPHRRVTMRCDKDANVCVKHSTERPQGRMITRTSEPCGHRLSGGLTGFGALASIRVRETRLLFPRAMRDVHQAG